MTWPSPAPSRIKASGWVVGLRWGAGRQAGACPDTCKAQLERAEAAFLGDSSFILMVLGRAFPGSPGSKKK